MFYINLKKKSSKMCLTKKTAPNNSHLAKIIHKTNIKIRYICISIMAQIIKIQQKIAPTNRTPQPSSQCNCRIKSTCPLPNKCQYRNIIYKVTVKTNNSVKYYIGAMEATIKQRVHNHNLSFKYRNYAFNTSISSNIWQIKDTNTSPTILF